MPLFHALTGCDVVSNFVGQGGKKPAQATWKVLPELTQALLELSCAPSDILTHVAETSERFTHSFAL